MDTINIVPASENATTSNPEAPAPEGQPAVSTAPEAAHQTAETQVPPTAEPPVAPVAETDNAEVGIPAKFVGKSLDDVLKAYKELERKTHEQATELSTFRKEKEQAPQQVAQPNLEPAAQPPTQQVKGMEDWLGEEFQRDWAQDPATAVQRDRQRRDQWRSYQDNYTKQYEFGQAAQQGRVPGFEDFGQHLPKMTEIAKQLAPLINPVYETHPELLKAVYYIAKGMSATDQLKKVATAKTQVSKAVDQEKLAASAESPSARGQQETVDPWSMKTEDLAKLIGHVDRSVEG